MSTLLAELCQVVEERAEPGPWLRRALRTLESRADAAGLRTWHVERVVYGALLLVAVVVSTARRLAPRPPPRRCAAWRDWGCRWPRYCTAPSGQHQRPRA